MHYLRYTCGHAYNSATLYIVFHMHMHYFLKFTHATKGENILRLPRLLYSWKWVARSCVRKPAGERRGPGDRWVQQIAIPQSGLLSSSSLYFSPSKWVFCIISIHIHAFSVPTWSCCTDRDKEAAIWSRPLSLPLNHTSRLSALMESMQLEPGPSKSTQALFILILNWRHWS